MYPTVNTHRYGFWMALVVALSASLLGASSASASHFRGATTSWTVPDPVGAPRTVRFVIRAGWRSGAVNGITWRFGDGASASSAGTLVGSGTDSAGLAYQIQEYVLTHTYASDGPFTAEWTSNARIGQLQNGANGRWRTFTTVDLRGGNIGPPITGAPILLQMPIDASASLFFPASDTDGDPVRCREAMPAEVGLGAGTEPRIGTERPSFSAVPGGCRINWNTSAGTAGQLYSLWLILESDHPGGGTSATQVDVIIELVSGSPPACTGGGSFAVEVGNNLMVPVTGTDPAGENLSVSAIGMPAGATLTPTSGASPLTTNFSWTPGAGDVGLSPAISLVFENDSGLATFCSINVTVPECGNGVRELGEECDDGNTDNTDACVMCQDAECGDGFLQAGVETCDDGNADNTDACVMCAPARCGDGFTQAGVEQCDDANAVDTDACIACVTATCGDGFVQAGVEECDDSNAVDTDACVMCQDAECGDGFVQAGVEECDDNNPIDTDACVMCRDATCGDGFVQAGVEECDDMNDVSTDACIACVTATCGDGHIQAGVETCDDMNADETDACAACQNASCGDGFVQTGVETCDDGNMSTTDGCVMCMPAACGDGFVHLGAEECDGNGAGNGGESSDCNLDCTSTVCGDGKLNVTAGEECDDGNAAEEDACLSTCEDARCGDGVQRAGVEECDDGNDIDADQCLTTCEVARCGDGVVLGGVEACDDGNVEDGDACNAECGLDSDSDGISDADETDDLDLDTPATDTDGDTVPDYLDLDSDEDGIPDAEEAGDDDLSTPPVDSDDDGTPDFRDADSDNDEVNDREDICLGVANADQADLDGDGRGDLCDEDVDGDGVRNDEDNCLRIRNATQADVDGDGIGSACDDNEVEGPEDEMIMKDAGCGCRIAGGPRESITSLFVLLLAVLSLRRRRVT